MMNLFLLLETPKTINQDSEIIANNFEYDLKKYYKCDQNVRVENKDKYTIFSDNITYFRNEEYIKQETPKQSIKTVK